MLSNYANSGWPISIIFPKRPNAGGWLRVAKLLKEVMIEANQYGINTWFLVLAPWRWVISLALLSSLEVKLATQKVLIRRTRDAEIVDLGMSLLL